MNAFIVINHVDDPVFVYKLSEGPGIGPKDDTGGSSSDDEEGGSGVDDAASTSGGETSTVGSDSGAAEGPSVPTSEGDGGLSDPGPQTVGCGCRTTTTPTICLLLALGGLGVRRRKTWPSIA